MLTLQKLFVIRMRAQFPNKPLLDANNVLDCLSSHICQSIIIINILHGTIHGTRCCITKVEWPFLKTHHKMRWNQRHCTSLSKSLQKFQFKNSEQQPSVCPIGALPQWSNNTTCQSGLKQLKQFHETPYEPHTLATPSHCQCLWWCGAAPSGGPSTQRCTIFHQWAASKDSSLCYSLKQRALPIDCSGPQWW